MEHLQRNVDENKEANIKQVLPVQSPVCESCDHFFVDEIDQKIHEKSFHKKDLGFSSDQIENLKALSQSRNLDLEPSLNYVWGRILQILPASEFGIVQVARADNQYINVLFDKSRLKIQETRHRLEDTLVPGYPALINAVRMEPSLPGYSENIPYYASAVTIGDEDDHNAMPYEFSTLKTELGSTLAEAQSLSKASLAIQLDMYSKGKAASMFHTFPDEIEFGTGTVVMKNQSVLLVRLQQENCYALLILESILLSRDVGESSEDTFEVGDCLHINALLMNPASPVQYLITGCWNNNPRATVPRSSLHLTAIDMFKTLSASYCQDPASYSILDMSNVLVPTSYGGIGFDDIAADIGEDDGGIADTSAAIVEDDPVPFKKIKLGSFAKSAD